MADQERTLSWQEFFAIGAVKPNLKHALIAQLEKDLQISFEETSPQAIYSTVMEKLKGAEAAGSLSQILYRIDVDERETAQAFFEEDHFAFLAIAVIKREAKKVWFRDNFG